MGLSQTVRCVAPVMFLLGFVAGCDSTGSADASRIPIPDVAASWANPAPATVTITETVTAPAFPTAKVYDHTQMQQDVHRVLIEGHGLAGVEDVSCPEGEPVRAESAFHCDVDIHGQPHRVTITVTSNDGKYSVGRPEPAR